MSKASEGVAFRFGMLIAGLEGAIEQAAIAGRATDLLAEEDRKRCAEAVETLRGIVQRAWERKGKP